ncbi:inositol monophosphatase [Mycobacterium hodleri]|uniref:inositol monophosphatase family protein n=1 Tax=Mycolicibacterium hodleri TaxID=49897 RepID=UPI0021F26B74|nr:inositol monophosphatase family protein [Mycolicibacterium hodleri]MCV7137346.1 inositol monophosphatase [Mycolicibacterium hodleri]
MPTDELLAPMTQAVESVAATLLRAVLPPPSRTWAEFSAAFDGIDCPATDQLRTMLDSAVPGVAWLGDPAAADAEGWFADVTDGAVQYLQGLPHWCVTLSYVRGGRAEATVIHSATRAETYVATRGGGARLNGQSIQPSQKSDLGVCIAATNQPPFINRQPAAITEAARSLAKMLPIVGAVRNFGPTSLQIADTAAGRVDIFWEYGRDEENLLGAELIAQEAGLAVSDAHGEAWTANSASFLAVPKPLRDDVITALAAA